MNKKNIIILILGLIVFISIIVGLIIAVYNNSELGKGRQINNETNTQNTQEESISVESFKTTYRQNGLKFKIEAEYPEDIEYLDGVDPDYYRNISKFEIYGLQNTQIQNNINLQISKIIESVKSTEYKINIFERANFADVLSLEVYIYDDSDEEIKYLKKGLNYRLDTGEQIYFTDIFKDKEDTEEILNTELVKRAISDKKPDNINNIEFTFTSNLVFIYNLGEEGDEETERNIIISLPDYADEVAIFSRFVSNDNLYTEKQSSIETQAFVPVSENGSYTKMDENTYLVQYYTDDIDENKKSKLERMASDELLKISTDSKKQVIVQNIGILDNNKGYIITEIYDIKDEYFESKDFYLTIAKSQTIEGLFVIEFKEDSINSYDQTSTQKDI